MLLQAQSLAGVAEGQCHLLPLCGSQTGQWVPGSGLPGGGLQGVAVPTPAAQPWFVSVPGALLVFSIAAASSGPWHPPCPGC